MRVQLQWDTGEEEGEELKDMMEEWDEYSSYYRDKDPEALERFVFYYFFFFLFYFSIKKKERRR
jgi:hypothetical protein